MDCMMESDQEANYTSQRSTQMIDLQHTFKILIATDNHLGYAEKDPVRGADSFNSFEEILLAAKEEKVDFVLLGGDMFHDNKPSRGTLFRTMNLLRRHCMGDGPIGFRIVSDQATSFPNYGMVNYEDPNYNIELPVFSIHGNHDDPTRDGGNQALAALDLLSTANLVNYFGKSERVDDIEIFPILMIKGVSKLAIYGLGNIRDERLNRMFAQKKVKFRRPAEYQEEWFNILVLHQNRDNRGRGSKNCIHESFIPDFIDFVVWGHEHECLIEVDESLKGKYYLTQPGSSVATSLVEGEAKKKHIGILEIKGQDFRLTPKSLETVRPFTLDRICLSEISSLNPTDPSISTKINKVLAKKIEEMIQKTKLELEEKGRDPSIEILIRLKVDHTGFPNLNNQRFGAQFVGKVANPNDLLLFHRVREKLSTGLVDKSRGLSEPIAPSPLDSVKVEDLISQKLECSDIRLSLFPEATLNRALEDSVTKNQSSAIPEFVEKVLDETKMMLQREKGKAISTPGIYEAVIENTKKTRATLSLEEEEQKKISKILADKEKEDMLDELMNIEDVNKSTSIVATKIIDNHETRYNQEEIDQNADISPDRPSPSQSRTVRRTSPKKKSLKNSPIKSKVSERKTTRSHNQRTIASIFSNSNLPRGKKSSIFNSKSTASKSSIASDDMEEVEDDDPIDSDVEVTQLTNVPASTLFSQTIGSRKRKLPVSALRPNALVKHTTSTIQEEDETEIGRTGTQLMKSWGRSKRH